jgi:hypothetical protein
VDDYRCVLAVLSDGCNEVGVFVAVEVREQVRDGMD